MSVFRAMIRESILRELVATAVQPLGAGASTTARTEPAARRHAEGRAYLTVHGATFQRSEQEERYRRNGLDG